MTRDPMSPAERAAAQRKDDDVPHDLTDAERDALDLNPIVDVYESDPYRGGGRAIGQRLADVVGRNGWDTARRIPEVLRILAWFETRP